MDFKFTDKTVRCIVKDKSEIASLFMVANVSEDDIAHVVACKTCTHQLGRKDGTEIKLALKKCAVIYQPIE